MKEKINQIDILTNQLNEFKNNYNNNQLKLIELEKNNSALQAINSSLKDNITSLQIDININKELLSKNSQDFLVRFESLQNEKNNAINQITFLQVKLDAITKNYDISEQKYNNLEQKYNNANKEYQENIQKTTEYFKQNLKSIAAEIIQQNRDEALKESKLNISMLIDPLKNDIKNFKEKIEAVHLEDEVSRKTLQSEIKNIIAATSTIGNKAESLADALKSKPKMQGNWGEMLLENILKESGLQKNISYIAQAASMQMQDNDSKLKQPDFIVNLPNNQHVIIDAKVSLVNYERYHNALNEDERQTFLPRFINDIKAHIDNLASKEYSSINSNTIDINIIGSVLMFVPIEGTYYTIMQYENGILHEYAWKKGIVIVSPYNLMPILRSIASLCRIEQQNKNAQAIAKQSGAIYDKVVLLLEDIENVEKNFHKVTSTFMDMKNKLRDGRGSLIARVENLKLLGAKTEKKIDQPVLEIINDE